MTAGTTDANIQEKLAADEGTVLLVDKPVGMTSFDVIYRLRRWCGIKRAGHAGTLDPNASGLLIVCVGRQTKRFEEYAGLDKEYVGTFQLGIKTPSFDMETEISERNDCSSVTEERLRSVVSTFVGKQLQTPPMYSAAKYRGKPLYKYARSGKTLERKEKEITVQELSITEFALPVVGFRVVCSKGTYVRSLVHDIGIGLGCGAVLTSLRRTRIGPYRVEDATTVAQLEQSGRTLLGESNGYRIPA